MLFKKTLKVASATALWMVALLGTNSAMAQTMLPTYSAEALVEGAGAMGFGINSAANLTAALAVTDPGVQFDLAQTGDGTNLYLRVSPTGMSFATGALPSIQVDTKAMATDTAWTAGTPVTGATATMTPGGALLYTIAGEAGRLNAGAIRFLATITQRDADGDDEAEVSAVGTAGLTMALYKDQRDGYLGSANHLLSGSTAFFHVAPSVKVSSATGAEPAGRTASAEAQFRQFIADDRNGMKTSLGGFNVTVNTAHLSAAGTALNTLVVDDGDDATEDPIDLAAVYAAVGINTMMSSSKFYGADGQGFAYASKFELNSMADCSGTGPGGAGTTGITSYPGMEVDEGEDEPDANEVVGGIAPNPWYLCVTVDADNEETIPRGDIRMDIALGDGTAANMTRLVSPAAANMMGIHVAMIDHDGTTVQVPYVTTFENYNQRLVIVNRSKNDVYFTVSFTTEDEAMATPETTDKMMVGGSMTRVLKMSDLVTFTGKTRGSATVVLQTGPGSVDVATTIVHQMTGATDTIVLH